MIHSRNREQTLSTFKTIVGPRAVFGGEVGTADL